MKWVRVASVSPANNTLYEIGGKIYATKASTGQKRINNNIRLVHLLVFMVNVGFMSRSGIISRVSARICPRYVPGHIRDNGHAGHGRGMAKEWLRNGQGTIT